MFLLVILFNTSGCCGFLEYMEKTFDPSRKLCVGAFFPDGSKIACRTRVRRSGRWKDEIWVMDIGGSNALKVAEWEKGGIVFAFFPNDNKHLLAFSGKKIYLVDVKPKEKKEIYSDILKLRKHDWICAISNDCSKVVLQKRTKWKFGFWNKHSYSIVNLHTSESVELLPLNKLSSITGGFSFSPDDSSIVFDNCHNIYSINVDGTGFRCLTKDANKIYKEIGKWGTERPIFSPDGKLIIFKTGQSLFIMKRDGAELNKIVEIEEGKGDMYGIGRFTPDSKQIVFVRTVLASTKGVNSGVLIVNTDGTGLRVLVDNEVARGRGFSPDGKIILFEGSGSGRDQRVLYTINLDGSNKKQIFPKPREH